MFSRIIIRIESLIESFNLFVLAPDGELIDVGVIDNWQNEVDGLKDDQDALNEFYRQFPRTEEHAFRDETKNSIFNLVKIYEQIDFNEDLRDSVGISTGNFVTLKILIHFYSPFQDNVKTINLVLACSSNTKYEKMKMRNFYSIYNDDENNFKEFGEIYEIDVN